MLPFLLSSSHIHISLSSSHVHIFKPFHLVHIVQLKNLEIPFVTSKPRYCSAVVLNHPSGVVGGEGVVVGGR